MESMLKSLKVPELKDILKKASVPVLPGKRKAELVATILADTAAVDAYNALYNNSGVTPQQKPSSKPKPAPKPNSPVKQLTNTPASPKKAQDQAPPPKPASIKPAVVTAVEDSELEKRKARAARFGIPVVESKQPMSAEKQLTDDDASLKARAERFGKTLESDRQPRRKRTRGAPEEPVDPEELERRKKRAERFGIPLAGA